MRSNTTAALGRIGLVVALLLAVACGNEPGKKEIKALGPLPDGSVYQAEATFTDQHGQETKWGSFRGKPVVAAMVFTNCQFACPAITQDIKSIQQRTEGDAQPVQFLLISFDTQRDTAETLQEFAEEMELDENWTLLHGSEADVRQLSMLLDVSYKDVGGGLFSHDNVITLLNANGEIVARSEGLGNENDDLLKKLKALCNPIIKPKKLNIQNCMD